MIDIPKIKEELLDLEDIASRDNLTEKGKDLLNEFLHVVDLVENYDKYIVSYCAERIVNMLTFKFTEEAKNHVGKKLNQTPELLSLLCAISEIEKRCS